MALLDFITSKTAIIEQIKEALEQNNIDPIDYSYEGKGIIGSLNPPEELTGTDDKEANRLRVDSKRVLHAELAKILQLPLGSEIGGRSVGEGDRPIYGLKVDTQLGRKQLLEIRDRILGSSGEIAAAFQKAIDRAHLPATTPEEAEALRDGEKAGVTPAPRSAGSHSR